MTTPDEYVKKKEKIEDLLECAQITYAEGTKAYEVSAWGKTKESTIELFNHAYEKLKDLITK